MNNITPLRDSFGYYRQSDQVSRNKSLPSDFYSEYGYNEIHGY